MMKRKSRMERIALRSHRRFNRNSKKIKYHDTDRWSWELPEGKRFDLPTITEEIENIFGKRK